MKKWVEGSELYFFYLSLSFCTFLYLSVPFCTFLYLSIPFCTFLLILLCTFLYLSVPSCTFLTDHKLSYSSNRNLIPIHLLISCSDSRKPPIKITFLRSCGFFQVFNLHMEVGHSKKKSTLFPLLYVLLRLLLHCLVLPEE